MTTPKELAKEGLRERLLEAVLAHTGVQPGWPHYDAGRVVTLVLNAVEPAIEAEFHAQAEEFRRLADLAQERLCYRLDDLSRASYEARQRTWEQAAQMLEERLNG